MASNETHVEIAEAAVDAVLVTIPPEVLRPDVGTGWHGFFAEGERLPFTPEPASDLRNPFMWARYALNPGGSSLPLGGSGGEWRMVAQFELRYQPGVRPGPKTKLLGKLRGALDAGDGDHAAENGETGHVTFFPDDSESRAGMRDGWLVYTQNVEIVVT